MECRRVPGGYDWGTETDEPEKTMQQIDELFSQITGNSTIGRVLLACALLIVVAIVSHLVVKWLKRLMARDDTSLPQSSIFINIARGLVWGLGICFILDSCFNVNMTALVAALGVGGIAISLGFQDTLANLIGGAQISFMRIIEPGDNIAVGTQKGVVRDITWHHTSITNSLGETIIIPNAVISKNTVVKLLSPERVAVPFVVTVGEDLDRLASRVIALSRRAAETQAQVSREPEVFFFEVQEEGVAGKVVVWIDDAAKSSQVTDVITRALAPLVRKVD